MVLTLGAVNIVRRSNGSVIHHQGDSMDTTGATAAMSDAMSMMEHPEDTVSALPLVDPRVLLRFCDAVQRYADGMGFHDEAARKLRDLRDRLENLRGLASLCRLAIAGHPRAVGRVVDELSCLALDFPSGPLKEPHREGEVNEDEPDGRVQLAAALDLFAGAAFVSKDNAEQHERFVVSIVRAVEDAIAFPVAYSPEAAAYLGGGDETLSVAYAQIVIANATRRLIESDRRCSPRVPAEIRLRLECLASKWLHANPVTEFFDVISGPKLRRIVFWQDPKRERPDDACVGDPVTLLVHEQGSGKGDRHEDVCWDDMGRFGVMFCPHQPAHVVRTLDDGFQVHVPRAARTGPIAVVHKKPDFTNVRSLFDEYADQYPLEWSSSIFAKLRMDQWAYPEAFGFPIIEIAQGSPKSESSIAFTATPPEMSVTEQPSRNYSDSSSDQ